MQLSKTWSVPVVLLGALLLAACNGDEPTPGSTSTPTTTATPTATASPAPTATATETPAATSGIPEGTTTGIAEIHAVIEAVLAEDVTALVALMQTVEAPCTNELGAGGPPKCWTGTTPDQARPAGTILEVFPYATCEFEWRIGLDSVADEAVSIADSLFAVLRLNQPVVPGDEDYLPEAEYGIVFSGTESVVVVAVQDGRVTFIDRACGAGSDTRAYIDRRPVYASGEVILRGPAYGE